ncbi:MAG: hypothetical protein IPN42_09095 [Methylococcaceae bacterium]|nr:hypothetical protein [Methylococcaceae bacterium]
MTALVYKPFDDLEQLATDAASSIETGQRHLNFFVSAELELNSILNKPLEDVTEKAQKWRAKEKPNDLYINHGEFIGDGLSHIINELKNKQTSNRALYSLISEKDIINQGDDPIPSFMIFQCTVVSDILYCTVYFRALEIANFFRINLEEIRLNLCEISHEIRFSKVRLAVLAFSAYKNPEQIPLERCLLDLMHPYDISDLIEDNPNKLYEILEIKAKQTTVIDTAGLEAIKAWFDPKREHKWPSNLKEKKILTAVDEAIITAKKLQNLRRSNSHHTQIDQVSEQYVQAIKNVAAEFKPCR